jgi:adenosylcobinamide-phosphate synthase
MGMTLGRRARAVAVGLVVDAVVGDPPDRCHPVAWLGRGLAAWERRWWADARARGAAYALTGVGGALSTTVALRGTLGESGSLVAATAVAAGGRSLLQVAAGVGRMLEAGELEAARCRLRALVGRDCQELDEKELARAVVESVAENLSDAVVATALWGLLGGTGGVLVHRAANTMDAMVGHRSARHRRFGWAAARLDDLLAWPAARLTALLVAAASPARAGAVWKTVRRDAGAHPSPNAGVAEAAFAGALGVRLGGVNRYGGHQEVRPPLGDGPGPSPADVSRAVALARRTVAVTVALLLTVALVAGQ